MSMSFERYMVDMVQPMRDDFTRIGIEELRTPEDVAAKLPDAKGTALVVVNSVCGCAAGQCRPGVAASFAHDITPITCSRFLPVKIKKQRLKRVNSLLRTRHHHLRSP